MIGTYIVCFLCTLFVLHVIAYQNKYCKLPCRFSSDIVSHTVCDRNAVKCNSGPKCGPDIRTIQLNDDDRQYILDIHNFLRNKVALGYEKRGAQPTASNMIAMSYNKELEFIAQCWANTCNGKPLLHDGCRRTEEFKFVGQNLGIINSSNPDIDIVPTIKDLILLWYDEVSIYSSSWVNDTRNRAMKVGHYTQLVWAETTDIGCAMTYYTSMEAETKWHHVLLVCNYGPAGNIIGQPVYKMGNPISNCRKGLKQNGKYKGLCGPIRNLDSTKAFKNDVF